MMQNKMNTITKNKQSIKSFRDLEDMSDDDNLNSENVGKRGREDNVSLDLNFYLLLSHKSKVTGFKLLKPDLYEGFKNAIPTVITTTTEKGWTFLWYENLMDKNVAFMCAHVFKPEQNDLINDVAFLDFPPLHPEKYHDLKEKKSYIFKPDTNKITMIKKSHNKLGVYQNSYDGTTYDWIFLLKKNSFEIYRAEGLRNFPIKNINIVLKSEIDFSHKVMPRLHLPTQILSISCRDFNDKISLYGVNKSYQVIKYRRDLLQKTSKSEWMFRNVMISKSDIITDIITHTDYPILLNKTISNELWFYFEEQSARQIVKFNNFKFIGQYNHRKAIKQISFINKIPGVIILNEDNSITIVCCDTFLKVLASDKYSEEFLDIWDTRRNNSYEKWVIVDEYSLVEDITDNVKSMQIISTHFDKSEAIIKILFIYEAHFVIMDVVISISSFKEFIVKIYTVSRTNLNMEIDKVLISSKTEDKRYHVLVTKKDRKPTQCLFKVEIDSNEKNPKMKVLWSSQALKTNNIRAVQGVNYLGIINDDEGTLYIYDLEEERYSGFIDIKKVLPDIEGASKKIEKQYVSDMLFCRNHAKGSIVVYYKDTVLLFSQINTEHLDSIEDEAWAMIHKFDNVLKLDNIKSVKIEESYYGKLLFIINNKYFLNKDKFLVDFEDNLADNKFTKNLTENKTKIAFEGLFTIFQESKPIYHPQLLKQFFLKGHMNLILTILCKLFELIKLESKGYKIPNF